MIQQAVIAALHAYEKECGSKLLELKLQDIAFSSLVQETNCRIKCDILGGKYFYFRGVRISSDALYPES